MMTFVLIAALFVVMLLFPIVVSYLIYRTSDIEVLQINATKTKDPRYFAKSFAQMMDKALEGFRGGTTIKLSHEERVIVADGGAVLPECCKDVVLSFGDIFESGPARMFEREVYAKGNAVLGEGSRVRAACILGGGIVESGVEFDRWVDSVGPLTVLDDCDLGISASSAEHLVIGRNCSFRRLFAPVVDVGTYPDQVAEPRPLEKRAFVSPRILWGKRDVDVDDARDNESQTDTDVDADSNAAIAGNAAAKGAFCNRGGVPSCASDSSSGIEAEPGSELHPEHESGVVAGTVITSHALRVLEGVFLAGGIRSHKSVRLCDGAVVCGNIFAEKDVVIGNGCRVLGSIFSQGNIEIGDDAVIGIDGQLRSVVARGTILFWGTARIYGYVNAEVRSGICPDEETGSSPAERPKRSYVPVPPTIAGNRSVSLSLGEADDVDTTLRGDARVGRMSLPFGATRVTRSKCFECVNLTAVDIPATLERIDDYAFFGCSSLKVLDLRHCSRLVSIGESAFEGCSMLGRVLLPASLTDLGTAAFRNCTRLNEVAFASPSSLKTIGSHCFMGCAWLRGINIPNGVTSVGMSAFLGCSSLQRLALPATVERIGRFFIAECASCVQLIVPRSLTEEEARDVPVGVEVVVRETTDGGKGVRSV